MNKGFLFKVSFTVSLKRKRDKEKKGVKGAKRDPCRLELKHIRIALHCQVDGDIGYFLFDRSQTFGYTA